MTNYEKLNEIYSEISNLIVKGVTSSSHEFKAWHMKAERFLIKEYGEDGIEYKNFKNTSFAPRFAGVSNDHVAYIAACKEGLLTTRDVFEDYLCEMKEESEERLENKDKNENLQRISYLKIFVVHGHDGELKEAVARLVEHAGLTPIILSEQVNRGATIIEKFEKNANVPAAICLFTADDFGREKKEDEERVRARQNVIFETGYLMGKLGRENIIIIADEGIEMPSDLSGVVRTDKEEWKVSLIKEMKDIGYKIDENVLF